MLKRLPVVELVAACDVPRAKGHVPNDGALVVLLCIHSFGRRVDSFWQTNGMHRNDLFDEVVRPVSGGGWRNTSRLRDGSKIWRAPYELLGTLLGYRRGCPLEWSGGLVALEITSIVPESIMTDFLRVNSWDWSVWPV